MSNIVKIGFIFLIITAIVYGITSLGKDSREYYYKTDKKVGNYIIYDYHSSKPYCKGFTEVVLYEEDNKEYYVIYECYGSGYFIKDEGTFLQLDEALDKNLITLQQIKDANITRVRQKE